VDYWTGDIWQTINEPNNHIILLSPRCDIAQAKLENLIVCQIDSNEGDLAALGKDKKKRLQNLESLLRDNVLGKAIRHLPKSPVFAGGKVDLSKHKTILKSQLAPDYKYIVTLSDDLTNEILGKFAYYFLRTGINTISAEEFNQYLELLRGSDQKAD
jgi:hypothetical protein